MKRNNFPGKPSGASRFGHGLLAICTLLAGAGHSSAAETEKVGHIQRTALDFLQELHADQPGQADITVGGLDSRLRLRKCDSPLVAFLPPNGRTMGSLTVGVRCPSATPWQVYLTANVSITRPVIVAAAYLDRGREVDPAQVRWVEYDLGTLHHGYLDDIARLQGMKLRRPVRAGSVITPGMLEASPLVERGDRVTLIVSSGALEVSAEGEVLASAAAGERVRVRNLSSRRVVHGELRDDRTVHIVR